MTQCNIGSIIGRFLLPVCKQKKANVRPISSTGICGCVNGSISLYMHGVGSNTRSLQQSTCSILEPEHYLQGLPPPRPGEEAYGRCSFQEFSEL